MIEWMRIGSPEIWEATKGMTAEETEQYISQRAQNAAETIKKYQELGHSLETANSSLERSRQEALAAADRWMRRGLGGGRAQRWAGCGSDSPAMWRTSRWSSRPARN